MTSRYGGVEETLQREWDALWAGYYRPQPIRVRHTHRFHPIDRRCVDCTVTEVEHHAVPYGVSIPCKLAERVTR